MKVLFVFLLVGLTFNSFGQRIEVHFYDSGNINYEYTYNEAGLKDGWQREWYENGQLWTKLFYIADKVDGLKSRWHENGQLDYEQNWKDGKSDGLGRGWHENGQLAYEQNWKDGKIFGLERRWNSLGQLWFEGNYKDGKRDGWAKTYYSHTGHIQITGKYKVGRIGIWRYYYSTAVNKEQKSKKEVYTETGDGVLISVQCWDEDGNEIECPEE